METILSIIKMVVLKVLYLIFLPMLPINTVILQLCLRNVFKRYERGLVEEESISGLIVTWLKNMHGHALWQDIICRLRQIFIVWNDKDFEHNRQYLVGLVDEMK